MKRDVNPRLIILPKIRNKDGVMYHQELATGLRNSNVMQSVHYNNVYGRKKYKTE